MALPDLPLQSQRWAAWPLHTPEEAPRIAPGAAADPGWASASSWRVRECWVYRLHQPVRLQISMSEFP